MEALFDTAAVAPLTVTPSANDVAGLRLLLAGAKADPQAPVPPLIMAFDKPYGQTSFQLVARVRRLLTIALGGRKVKIGHAGTLDPLATGVVVMCTGRATKEIERLQAGVKVYDATLRLGATTPSFDLEHEVDATFPTDHITPDLITETLAGFRGDIMQVPPVYSACKVDGKRAYHLARKGQAEEVKLEPKLLRIDDISLTDCRLTQQEIDIHVVCSKGTYIRALARDIGQALHSGAHLSALRRTRVGHLDLAACFRPDTFADCLGLDSDPTATAAAPTIRPKG